MAALRAVDRLLVVSLLLASAGCPVAVGNDLEFSCSDHADCVDGYMCVGGVCRPEDSVADAAIGDVPSADAGPGDHPGDDASVPDAPRPDGARPDAPRPDGARPDAPRPDAARPDSARADALAPDLPTGDTSVPDGTAADALEADTAVPDATPTDTPVTDAAEPDTWQPDTTAPDTWQPDTAEPDVWQPDAAEPDAARPSCDTTFGGISGYELCVENDTECWFYVDTYPDIYQTCTEVCDTVSAACVDGYNDGTTHCTLGSHDGCERSLRRHICVCER